MWHKVTSIGNPGKDVARNQACWHLQSPEPWEHELFLLSLPVCRFPLLQPEENTGSHVAVPNLRDMRPECASSDGFLYFVNESTPRFIIKLYPSGFQRHILQFYAYWPLVDLEPHSLFISSHIGSKLLRELFTLRLQYFSLLYPAVFASYMLKAATISSEILLAKVRALHGETKCTLLS